MDKMAAADSFQDTLGQAVALDQARENRQWGAGSRPRKDRYLTQQGGACRFNGDFKHVRPVILA
jgi:hypothetical protein